MRWKKDPEPTIGDHKVTKKYVWYPIVIDDTYVWLEYVKVNSRYEQVWHYNKFGRRYLNHEWVVLSYSLI